MNQSSTVELIVKVANAVNPLRQAEKQAKKTSEAIRKSALGFEAVSKASLKVKKRVEATQGGFAKASKVVGTFSAKVLNTEKAMRAQIRALREVQSTVKFNGAIYKKAGAEIARYEAILKSANSTAEKAKTANGGLAAGLRNLAIGFGAARAAQATLQAGIRRDESERRLRLLTQRFGETAQAQEAAQRAADRFNLSQTEANVQLSRLIARLRPMGLSMATIETAFAGFNTATILAGATASESAGAFLQLSQALGSGVLRGQELNSILEQAPLIAQAIATEMGSTVGALKKFGEDGKITSDIVIRALGRVEREGAGQLEKALEGPAAAIKAFQNATEDVQVALTQDIIPEMAKSFRELADLIRSLGPLFRGVGADIGGGLGAINDLIDINRMSKTESARSILERGRIAPGERGLPELFEPLGGEKFVARLRTQAANAAKFTDKDVTELFVDNLQRALKTLDARAATLPSNFDMMVMNAADPKKKQKSPELSDEEKKRLERIRKQNIAAKTKFFQAKEELAVLLETNEIEKIRLDFGAQRADLQRNYASLIADAKSDEERLNLLAALRNKLQVLSLEQNVAITDEIEKRTKTFSDQLAHQDELNQLLQGQNDIFADIGQTIQDGLIRGIEDAITGAKSLSEALSGVFKSIGGTLLRSAITSAVGGINFGGGGGTPEVLTSGIDFFTAEGGYASGATNAVVGEAGPEYIIPESKMRESMARYSRGVRGSAVIPENGEGGTNGMGGGTALAAPIDVRFSVERINSVDYVTADQFQRGMQQAAADGAKQGEQRALTTLRQNTSQRRRIGL